ncbi:hypothetical protein NDU88_001313 [Pleurodeles waltl]|uniref:Uncharacterized protein n=1 Tax=Pleurodeles waltl TaxID=8319 RepID=A0AAV7WL53_PLEWA|nr:hypothetical protein NDU88_001313 [Pleurodeles waltl]
MNLGRASPANIDKSATSADDAKSPNDFTWLLFQTSPRVGVPMMSHRENPGSRLACDNRVHRNRRVTAVIV